MTRTRFRIFENKTPYFLTNTIVAWLPVFAYPQFAGVIFESWRFLQEESGIPIYGYVVMENHIHWIASGDELNDQVRNFKSYTAGKIQDGLKIGGVETLFSELNYFKLRHKGGQRFQVWQVGTHPIEIQDEFMMRRNLDYIHLNPVRRGYVDVPEHWRYSNALNYDDGGGMINITKQW